MDTFLRQTPCVGPGRFSVIFTTEFLIQEYINERQSSRSVGRCDVKILLDYARFWLIFETEHKEKHTWVVRKDKYKV